MRCPSLQAPLEVVCVLKALAEDGELTLGDGRRLLSSEALDAEQSEDATATTTSAASAASGGSGDGSGGSGALDDGRDEGTEDEASERVVRIHPDFRMVVLANRPGWYAYLDARLVPQPSRTHQPPRPPPANRLHSPSHPPCRLGRHHRVVRLCGRHDTSVCLLCVRPHVCARLRRPFLGNDFFRECGDVFASSVVDALDLASELQLLRAYAPSAAPSALVDMALLFAELRDLADGGTLAYPYR